MAVFKIGDILKVLPHAHPFLLLDRVLSCNPGKEVSAIKCVSYNEPFFVGQFPPAFPVMPGVLIVEAMAQAATFCKLVATSGDKAKVTGYFTSIESAKFRQPVIPGDVLEIECTFLRERNNINKFSCVARVGSEKVCEASIAAMIRRT